jgi:hypothetical protein
VQLSLHGARADVHDYHVGTPGAFVESVAGLAAAVAAGLTAVVATVLTRSNARVLGELPWFLRSRGVAGWLIEVPRTAGRLSSAFDRIYPRLGIAVPFALHALDAAERVRLPAWIRGAPRCLVGPFVARAMPDAPRAFGKACASCGERASCCGVDPIYLARFDGDELRAPVASSPTVRADALWELFAGVGPYEPPAAVEPSAPAPAAARRLLPLLGKVQPAVAEVPASTPRRSGEALKEIFPDLFAKPGQGS